MDPDEPHAQAFHPMRIPFGVPLAVLLALGLPVAKPASAATSYYETGNLSLGLRGFASMSQPQVRRELRTMLKKGVAASKLTLQRLGPEGAEPASLGGKEALSPEAMAAALLALTHDARGAELDALVGLGPGPELHPVTVWWDDRVLTLSEGPPIVDLLPERPTAEELVRRYGLAGIQRGDREWDPVSVGLLAQALGLLSPEERLQVASVAFVRRSRPLERMASRVQPTGAREELIALYQRDGAITWIEIYDAALEPVGRFVGSPDAPKSAHVGTILAMLGHALADADARRAQDAYQGLSDRWQALRPRFDALVARQARPEVERLVAHMDGLTAVAEALSEHSASPSPVVELYMEAMRDQPPVTRQRYRDADERFATAFAVYHADRDALARVSPVALRFFDDGAHISALERAWVPVQALIDGVPADP